VRFDAALAGGAVRAGPDVPIGGTDIVEANPR
jgi:hypothetical protein